MNLQVAGPRRLAISRLACVVTVIGVNLVAIYNQMAQFYGSAPGEDPGQNSYGTQYFEREEIISSLQDGQSA